MVKSFKKKIPHQVTLKVRLRRRTTNKVIHVSKRISEMSFYLLHRGNLTVKFSLWTINSLSEYGNVVFQKIPEKQRFQSETLGIVEISDIILLNFLTTVVRISIV